MMDAIFKNDYKYYAFSNVLCVEPDWIIQVHTLPELWKDIGQVIDRTHFAITFMCECEELGLPHHTYDLNLAFHKAQYEWAEELIIATATLILKWYIEVDEEFNLPDGLVAMEHGHIVLKQNVCQLIMNHLDKFPFHTSEMYWLWIVDKFTEYNDNMLSEHMNGLTL